MFALVDVNSFFASCEQVFQPALRHKPVVVLSNNDGCVIARSAQAKQLGVKMGQPWFSLQKEAQQKGIIACSSNYALYADMSDRVMMVLRDITPAIQVYSIDEAFCDLTGIRDLTQFAHHLREQVRQRTHLTVGIGIAPTKTLAKLANHAAKTYPKTQGVVVLTQKERQKRLRQLISVSEVWGVGRRITAKLMLMGIKTADDLANADKSLIRKSFSVILERTVRELNGEMCIGFKELPDSKKQIICSRSFGKKTLHYDDLHQAICSHAEKAAEKLRQENQYCQHITAFIGSSLYEQEVYRNDHSIALPFPTNDTRDIIQAALSALQPIFKAGIYYQKAGVALNQLGDGKTQFSLFDEEKPNPKSQPLMSTIDCLNQSGKYRLFFAGQGIDKKWKMKQDNLSPSWTTSLSDIPIAKCR